jgi:hypothetical protein
VRVRELQGHARADASVFGRELGTLFGWWLSVDFGLTCAAVGLFGVVWPDAVERWNSIVVGMWLLTFAMCHCVGAGSRPLPSVLRRTSLAAGLFSAVVGAYCVRVGGRPGDTLAVVALCLAVLAATNGASAARYGWRSWFGARAAVSLAASQLVAATVVTGTVPATALAALAFATGALETAYGAYDGLHRSTYSRRLE